MWRNSVCYEKQVVGSVLAVTRKEEECSAVVQNEIMVD
jgi:hypothetical protein